jgi:hypothetical protein
MRNRTRKHKPRRHIKPISTGLATAAVIASPYLGHPLTVIAVCIVIVVIASWVPARTG